MVIRIAQVHMHGRRELADVVGAGDSPRILFGLRQSWKEQRGKNGDDRDDDQQLN
jgi:hypothetical protein